MEAENGVVFLSIVILCGGGSGFESRGAIIHEPSRRSNQGSQGWRGMGIAFSDGAQAECLRAYDNSANTASSSLNLKTPPLPVHVLK